MISVQEAKKLIVDAATTRFASTTNMGLMGLLNYILAENIKSKVFSPPFNQSAMDGYALKFTDLQDIGLLKIIGENPAGDAKIKKISNGECARIFTGAMMPEGADTVVPQEFVEVSKDGFISIKGAFAFGDNVRLKGSQFSKGELLLVKGQKLNTHSITLLASAGHQKAKVYCKPSVSILVTGTELIKPDNKITKDKIIETNSIMLYTALKKAGIECKQILFASDELSKIKKQIIKAFKTSEIVLISGGISVGKYDYVKIALEELSVKPVFYKIKQKPGKPLYFGKTKQNYIFGLPGNPAASLTCFYEYVQPLLKILSGEEKPFPITKSAVSLNTYRKKEGLSHFLKAKLDDKGVEILGDQESFKISSFNKANCLAYIPEEITEISIGQTIACHIIQDYD